MQTATQTIEAKDIVVGAKFKSRNEIITVERFEKAIVYYNSNCETHTAPMILRNFLHILNHGNYQPC